MIPPIPSSDSIEATGWARKTAVKGRGSPGLRRDLRLNASHLQLDSVQPCTGRNVKRLPVRVAPGAIRRDFGQLYRAQVLTLRRDHQYAPRSGGVQIAQTVD